MFRTTVFHKHFYQHEINRIYIRINQPTVSVCTRTLQGIGVFLIQLVQEPINEGHVKCIGSSRAANFCKVILVPY